MTRADIVKQICLAVAALWTLAGVGAFHAAAQAESAPARSAGLGPLLVNAPGRDGIDLSGPWTYSIDPYRDGLSGFHGSPAGEGHRRWDDSDVDEITRRNPAALYEYDMRRSHVVHLPAS